MDASSSATSRNGNRYAISSAVQFRETCSSYSLNIPFQGFRKEDVKVEMHNNRVLMIKVKEEIDLEGVRSYKWRLMQPFRNSSMKKPFKVPQDVNVPAVSVFLHQGNLQVIMPKFKTSVRHSPSNVSVSAGRRRGHCTGSPAIVATETLRHSGHVTACDSEIQEPEQHQKVELETKEPVRKRKAHDEGNDYEDDVTSSVVSKTERPRNTAFLSDPQMQQQTKQHQNAEHDVKDSCPVQHRKFAEEAEPAVHEVGEYVEPLIDSQDFNQPDKSEMMEIGKGEEKIGNHHEDGLEDAKSSIKHNETRQSDHKKQTIQIEKATAPMHVHDSSQAFIDSQQEEKPVRGNHEESMKRKNESDNIQKAEEAEIMQDDKTPISMELGALGAIKNSNTTSEELIGGIQNTGLLEDPSKTHLIKTLPQLLTILKSIGSCFYV